MKHIKISREVGTKWLAALRGGEFQQGCGYLEKDGKYCCLGVLQMVTTGFTKREAGQELPQPGWLRQNGVTFLNWFGEPTNNPYIKKKGIEVSTINDSGVKFPEIADLLEGEMEFTDEVEEGKENA